jgi:hypothetical protein
MGDQRRCMQRPGSAPMGDQRRCTALVFEGGGGRQMVVHRPPAFDDFMPAIAMPAKVIYCVYKCVCSLMKGVKEHFLTLASTALINTYYIITIILIIAIMIE